MNVLELIKEKLEEEKTKSVDMEITPAVYYEEGLDDAISIVDEVAQEYNNGWISCSEKMPKVYQEVLVCYLDKTIRLEKFLGVDIGFECDNKYDDDKYITDWQPLPTLPAPYKEGGTE